MLMVLALVAGGVVVEDGLARWVRWQSGRRAPWAASSAALGVAVPDSECVHSQADVIHFIAWLAHELRGTVRLCALDGAVWGRRPWWAVWLVVRRVVVAVDAAVTFGVAVLDGEGVVPKGAVSLWGAWPGGCDLFFSLAAPVLVGSVCLDDGVRRSRGARGGAGEGEGEGGDGGGGCEGGGEGEGEGEWEELSAGDGGPTVGACGRCVARAAATHREVGP